MKTEEEIRNKLNNMLSLDMSHSHEGWLIKAAVCRALLWTLGEDNNEGSSKWEIPKTATAPILKRDNHATTTTTV